MENDTHVIKTAVREANSLSKSKESFATFIFKETGQIFNVLTNEQLELIGNLKLRMGEIDDRRLQR